MKRLALYFGLLAIFAGCGGDTVYKEFNRNFTDHRWMKNDIRVYTFQIPEEARYDILIDYSHVYDTPLSSVPVKVSVHQKDKVIYEQPVSILIKDENGKHLGDCMGDYCDIRQKALSETLKEGEYSVRLTNLFDFDYMPNILGIGVRVMKSSNQ